MSAEKLSIRYAKALFDLAVEKNMLGQIKDDMALVEASVKGSKELQTLVESPVIKAEQKLAALRGIFESKISAESMSFIALLVKKHREAAVLEVVNAFTGLYNQKNNIVAVTLKTATPVSEETKEKIKKSISGNVALTTEIHPDLIGGFVLEYNNKLMDASVARSLELMKQQFSKN